MQITDLETPFLSMTEEEQQLMIRKVRAGRFIKKKIPTKTRKQKQSSTRKAETAARKLTKLEKQIGKMSPHEVEQLLKRLKESK